MLKKPKSKQKSVAERVAELITHPNQSGSDSDSDNEATAPRVIDFDEDEYQMPEAGTTEFRKRNVKLLSEQSSKYKGKIASRKDFEEEDVDDDDEEEQYEESDDEEDDEREEEEEEPLDSEEDDEALKAFSKALRKTQTDKRAGNISDEGDEDSNDEQEVESDGAKDDVSEGDDDAGEAESDAEKNESHAEEAESDAEEAESDAEEAESDAEEDEDIEDDDDETEVISKVNREAEIQKGISVQNQLRLWERLLELRINSQKFLSKANQLPAPNELKELEAASDKQKAILQETTKQTQSLLYNLVSLQNVLYSQYSEVNKSMKDALKRPSPFKEHQTGEPPLKQMNVQLQERFETFRSYRNTVLLKWDDRTKLLTPGAGAKKKSMDEDYDIIKKVNNALMNKSMLIQKSQQTKNAAQQQRDSNAHNLEELTVVNCNIYDDTDFYHQQLRELIEYKANTSNNMSEVTRQFLELQKLRQKMKKKVDTRASKGRKLRYVVHNKLINFMAPNDNSTWTDESKEELCKSLFV